MKTWLKVKKMVALGLCVTALALVQTACSGGSGSDSNKQSNASGNQQHMQTTPQKSNQSNSGN